MAVFGTGGVGLAAIQGALIAGARMIIAVDVIEHKLETAKRARRHPRRERRRGGSRQGDPRAHRRGVDYAFEAIGLKKAAEQAFECLRPGGTATIVGMIPVGQKIELDGRVVPAREEGAGLQHGL